MLEEDKSVNDDFGEGLVDSDKAGQETAPITGPTSTTPFDGLFQASFFGRPALPLLASGLSAAMVLSAAGDDVEAALEGKTLSVGSGREQGGGEEDEG